MTTDFSMSPLAKKQEERNLPVQDLICTADIYSVSPMASSPDPDSFSYPAVIFLSEEVENYGEDGVFTYHKPVLVSLDEILTKMEGK